MRTQYLLAALLVASAGCESTKSGQDSEPPGAVRIMRVMVQDAIPLGARGVAMDLLDVPGSALSTAVACDDVNPCTAQYNIQYNVPDVSCRGGLCTDPLRAGNAPLTPPETHRRGELGGTQVRIVFSKLLADGVENTPNLIEVDDWTGAAVAGMIYWDPSSSVTTVDPVVSPFGPAIVFKPNAPLAPHATYTIKLAPSLRDRQGHAVADQSGNVLAGPFTMSFTTEDLAIIALTTTTDVTAAGLSLKPDEILQFGFNAGVDAATVACTVTSGTTTVAVRPYSEAGAACGSAVDATVVDLVAADGTGAAIDWAAGSYSIGCTGKDNASGAGTFSLAGSFTVAGAATAGDPQSRAKHAICN
jgi:Big-like domain-containing protein